MKEKAIVLLSGGMDSVCALYDSMAKYEVVLSVSFDYGSKHNAKELPYAEHHSKLFNIEYIVIELSFMEQYFESSLLKGGVDIPEGEYKESNMKQTVVPFRNGIMLSIAAGLAESRGCNVIVIGAHADDNTVYPDCREEFISAFSSAMVLGTYSKVKVYAPFINMNKTQIALRGKELDIDFSKTWSCYKGEEHHCGKCGTCVQRINAFKEAQISDPTTYNP